MDGRVDASRLAHAVVQPRVRHHDAAAGEVGRLAIERQAQEVLAHDDLVHEGIAGLALGDQRGKRRRDDQRLAGVAQTPALALDQQAHVLLGDQVQALGHLVAQQRQRLAVGTDPLLGRNLQLQLLHAQLARYRLATAGLAALIGDRLGLLLLIACRRGRRALLLDGHREELLLALDRGRSAALARGGVGQLAQQLDLELQLGVLRLHRGLSQRECSRLDDQFLARELLQRRHAHMYARRRLALPWISAGRIPARRSTLDAGVDAIQQQCPLRVIELERLARVSRQGR